MNIDRLTLLNKTQRTNLLKKIAENEKTFLNIIDENTIELNINNEDILIASREGLIESLINEDIQEIKFRFNSNKIIRMENKDDSKQINVIESYKYILIDKDTFSYIGKESYVEILYYNRETDMHLEELESRLKKTLF